LGDNPECGKNPNLLCNHCLLFGSHRRKQTESRSLNLQNIKILSIYLLDKTPVREVLTKCDYKDVKEQNINQLKISGF
jgi:hypothetical protein